MKRRVMAIALALTLAALAAAGQLSPVAATTETGGAAVPSASNEAAPKLTGWTKAAETDRLTLHYEPATAEIAVTDKASGAVWLSNPVDRDSDETAKGAKKMELSSQLLIDYVDDLNKPFQANSLTGSVNETPPVISEIEGGIEIRFVFPKAGLTIPVRYTLEEDALSAVIDTAGIEQADKYRIVNLALLPFFGAGGTADDGYLLVPDGSGALIRFNNGKGGYRSYNERMYGGEAALDLPTKPEIKESARLPVFGLNKGDKGYVAVISQGAYQAGIIAEPSGRNNGYNNVYSYLNMKEFETNLLLEGTLNEKQVTRSSDSMAGDTPFEVRYYFLDGELESSYAGMAQRYKSYLVNELGVKAAVNGDALSEGESSLPLLLDFMGGAKKRETFLGIPYNTVETLSSFDDVSKAVDGLINEGLTNVSVRMQGWSAGGAKDEVPVSIKAEGKLGGTKGFRKLSDELAANGVDFYPAVDPVRLYEGGNGFGKFADAAKGISRAPALKYDYRLSDRTKDKKMSRWYLMKPDSVAEAIDRFTKDAAKKQLQGVSLQSVGSIVYSDFKRGGLSKNETGRLWEQALQNASATMERVMFDQPNGYTFPYASALSDVPLHASGFDVTDEAVPFYSIVTSGLIPAYSRPINLSSMQRDYSLKLIETGTYPAYQFIARDSSLLAGTEFDHLYSGEFELWRTELLDRHAELSAAMERTEGQAIVNHRKLEEGVYETTFENGVIAVVNYNDHNVAANGVSIPAHGYLVR